MIVVSGVIAMLLITGAHAISSDLFDTTSPNQSAAPAVLSNLDSGNPTTCEQVERSFNRRHDGIVLALEAEFAKMVDNPKGRYAAVTTVHIIGHFRAAHSAPLLAQHIDFTAEILQPGEDPTKAHYPCLAALVSIGNPALDPVIENVGFSDDPNVYRLSALVIAKVLGKKLGMDYVQEKIDISQDHIAISRVEKMDQILKDLPESECRQPEHIDKDSL